MTEITIPAPDEAPLSGPGDDPGRALSSQEIARATLMIMGAYVLSGIMGLVRQMVIAATFGAGVELDAFVAAVRVPETLFMLIAGGALGSAFIPVFSKFLSDDNFDGAWRLASAVLSMVGLIAIGLATLAFVFAAPIVETILIPGGDTRDHELTIELMRIMLVTVFIFGMSGLLMGILNAHQYFLSPALAPSLYNVGIIFGAIALTPSMGVHGLAWGTVIGSTLHLGVQLPSLRKLPYMRMRPLFSINVEGVREVLTLMLPRLLGLAVVQINFWVNIALASAMVKGSIAVLQTAYTLMFTVLGVLGQSLGTAVFPTLSTQHAKGDLDAFQQTFSTALRNVLFLSIPAGLGMAVLSIPIVGVLFERGEWTHDHTQAAAWALIFYAIGLAGHAALEILARTYFALHDTWTPVKIGGLAMLLNVLLSFAFVVLFEALGADEFTRGPFGGLALANSLATALESTVLWLILRRRIEALDAAPIALTLSRTIAATAVMVGTVLLWLNVAEDWHMLLRLVIGVLLGAGVFFVTALLFKVPQARHLPQQILARFR